MEWVVYKSLMWIWDAYKQPEKNANLKIEGEFGKAAVILFFIGNHYIFGLKFSTN